MRACSSSIPLLLPALALLVSGCAGAEPRVESANEAQARARVAVLPSTWATESQLDAVDASASFAAGLEESGMLETTHGSAVARAIAGRPSDCTEDAECVREVGRQLAVDQIAVVQLASLGATVMVRVRLLDVAGGTTETSRQTVVQEASAPRVEAAVADMGRELAPAPAAGEPERWYQKWWVWTLVGAALVGAGAAVVIAAQPDEQGPEIVITPP